MEPEGPREAMQDPFELTGRRNFLLNLFEGALFIAGGSLISSQTVLPALVSRLGGGNVAIGAVGVVVYAGLFLPQLFAARYAQALPWKKPWAVGFGAVQRFIVLLIGSLLMFAGGVPPAISLSLFFLLFTLLQVATGISTPGWFDLFTKLTPVSRRGRLSGMRTSIGGFGGLLCGMLLTVLLTVLPFPMNYASAFLVAAALQGVSLVLQLGLVEDAPSAVMPRLGLSAYAGQLGNVLKANREFRIFLSSSVFLVLATLPMGFFTVYALKRFHAPESVVGEFTLMLVAVQVVSAMVNGFLADRYGNRVVVLLAGAAMSLACLWALLAPTLGSFRLVFVFAGMNLGSDLMARYNMSVEYGPTEQRSTYIGLMNTFLAPVYLFGLAGGWVSDQFGYETLFVLGVLSSVVALSLFLFRVRDPRHENLSPS
jgi:MFS family permease